MNAPDTNISETLETVTLMRFLGTPGVPRLLAAYSRIPPGMVRENLIATAESIADAYDMPPPGPMADPLLVTSTFHPVGGLERGGPPPEAPQLEGPGRRSVRRGVPSLEEQVVNLRMNSKYPDEIAIELDMDAGKVGDILREAREQGGLKYPKLPHREIGHGVFHTDLKFLSNLSRGKFNSTAAKYRMSLEQLMAARRKFVELRRKGAPMDEISRVVKLPEKELWQWLYRARAAGIDLPLDVASAPRPSLPIRPINAPTRLPTAAQYIARGPHGMGAATKIKNAAAARGISIADYEYMREVVVDYALAGMRSVEIAQLIGEDPGWVNGMLSYARKQLSIPKPIGKAPAGVLEAMATSDRVPDLAAVGEAFIARMRHPDQMTKGARTAMEKAAAKRGLTTEAYEELRARALRMRFAGISNKEVAAQINEEAFTVRDWCKYAMQQGAKFPRSGNPQPVALAAE